MSVAFIVDGLTEKKIVQSICPNVPVRMTQLNGRDVSIETIAKAVATLYRTYKGRHFPVFVILDREARSISSEQMKVAVVGALAGHDIPSDQIIVCCPDRMIENWMLSDDIYFARALGCDSSDLLDGCYGKVEFRRLLRNQGRTYHEIRVGVEVFRRVCPVRVAGRSVSFARFAKRAGPYCAWVRRKKKLPARI